jgi:hypothetical protein
MMAKTKKFNVVDYKLRLYQLRSSLQHKGVKQPVMEMIGRYMIKKSTKNWDYLNGRTINLDFLEKLEELDNSI